MGAEVVPSASALSWNFSVRELELSLLKPSIGKLHNLGHFVVIAQLIHGLMWADISCTITQKQS